MQKFPLDPHRDPHGETCGWKQWNKQAATSSFLDKKLPKNLVQQGMEGSTAVGKDEVGSSNLPSSSKKHRKLRFLVLFVAKILKNVWVKMWVNCLTHTVTHTRNKLYPRKWTRDFDPWSRSADTHLTHRGRSAAPVL